MWLNNCLTAKSTGQQRASAVTHKSPQILSQPPGSSWNSCCCQIRRVEGIERLGGGPSMQGVSWWWCSLIWLSWELGSAAEEPCSIHTEPAGAIARSRDGRRFSEAPTTTGGGAATAAGPICTATSQRKASSPPGTTPTPTPRSTTTTSVVARPTRTRPPATPSRRTTATPALPW